MAVSALHVLLRHPVTTSSSLDLNERKTIAFKHPSYPDELGQNILLRLQAYDETTGGIHHRTALTVCGLLACNKWDGFLTIERDDNASGLNRIRLDDDDILLHNEYYFHLPGHSTDSEPYPIYRSFKDWRFPHNNLPPLFGQDAPAQKKCQRTSATLSASKFSFAILTRDNSCRVTDSADYVQAAHLCPSHENLWFGENNMSRYNKNAALQVPWAIDDVSNGIVLRPDLHKAFDDRKFTLVPKQNLWVAHFFGRTNNLGASYHNQVVDVPDEVHPAFLLTRLAWTIFPLIGNFLSVGIPRFLTARVKGETIKEATGYHSEWDIRVFLEASKASARRGSESPQKRESPNKRRAPSDEDAQTLLEEAPAKRQYQSYPVLASEAGYAGTLEQASGRHDSLPAPRPWDLQSCSGDSAHSLPSRSSLDSAPTNPCEDKSELARETKEYNRYISLLKRKWILEQRPRNPSLYCCNYEQAEQIAEKRSHGQSRPLCWQCLGYEYSETLIDDMEDAPGTALKGSSCENGLAVSSGL